MNAKTCLVTGANTGIGRVTAVELAKLGAHVVLACRSEDKTQPVLQEIADAGGSASFLPLDLGDLSSVRAAAERFLAEDRPLHVLVNNAGLAGHQGLTKDGFEITFGVNHLGHYLFTRLLLDRILSSAPARIVNVSSQGHYRADGFDWEAVRRPTATVTGLPEYQVSKLANVMFSKALVRRLEGTQVTTYSLHPGVVATDVWRRVPGPLRWLMTRFMISSEDGAATTLYCATSEAVANETGLYYDEEKVKEPNKVSHDEALQEELWRRSAEWVGLEP